MANNFKYLVLATTFGFVFTYLLIPLTKRLAWTHGFLAYPGPRKIHSEPIPVLGGLAIFAPQTFLLGGYLYLLATDSNFIDHSRIDKFLSLFLGTLWILGLGILDDKINLSWRKKLLGQILGVGILIVGGNTIGQIMVPFYGVVDLGLFGYLVFGFIVLFITNAINLIDGMDGLAAGICLFVAVTCGILGFHNAYMFVTVICFTIAGSLLAFLRFNFPPATIFMGDAGSLSLGFMLSALAISNITKGSSQRYMNLTTFMALFLPFGIAMLDVVLSVARRWISGRKIFLPDADHIHHRFMEMFKRPRLVVGIFYVFSSVFCSLTLLLTITPESHSMLFVGSLTVLVLIGVMVMVLNLYRVKQIKKAYKNRRDCMFLSTFNTYKEMRIQRTKSINELIALLETGVRDLNFDMVEVSMNVLKHLVWNNERKIYPDSPRRNGQLAFRDSEIIVRWVIPTHDDHDYQKYLELTWLSFLSAVERKHWELNRLAIAASKANSVAPASEPDAWVPGTQL